MIRPGRKQTNWQPHGYQGFGFFIHGLWSGSPPDTRGRSPVCKSRTPGSVRGVSGNGYPYRDIILRRPFFSSHLVAVVCNHLLFLQKQGNFRRIAASPENRYLIKCNILKYSAFILSGVIMNTGLRQVLRYAGVPVDAAEPVRRQFGSGFVE